MIAGKEDRKRSSKPHSSIFAQLFLFFLIFIILLSVYRWLKRPKLYRVEAFQPYQKIEKGQGAAVFYEFEPSFFRRKDWSKDSYQLGDRYRKDTVLFSLNASETKALNQYNARLKKLLNKKETNPVSRLQANQETEYYDQVLTRKEVFMPFSGLVSGHVDGFESLYAPELIGQLKAKSWINSVKMDSDPGLKFIDNRLYYILLQLPPSKKNKEWRLGETYPIQLGKKEIQAELDRVVQETDRGTLLIFTSKEGFSYWDKSRFQPLSLVVKDYMTYRLPRNSIFKEEGIYYCYVMGSDFRAKKAQVYPLAYDRPKKEFILDGRENIQEEDPNAYSIKALDQVVLDPDEIEEGDILR